MSRTAFTGSEWKEFVDGFDDPEEAYHVADMIWKKERFSDLKKLREFCTDRTSKDLLEAAYALATTNSDVFHEIKNRLKSYLYENSEDYRDALRYRRAEQVERRYFG